MPIDKENLVHRIARLAKEKKELIELNEKLARQNDQLTLQNQRYKLIIEKISPENLQEKPTEKAPKHHKFRMATVLFSGISGFNNISHDDDSSWIMDQLDGIFHFFDQVVKKRNIQKIKTLGDTYMSAGGIPVKNITNPIEVVIAALEMKNYLNCLQKGHDKTIWKLNIGIHTGSVIAHISGKRKKSYEIKGDTVNIAHRMKDNSGSGQILISISTYELVKEFFTCEYVGKIPVKYKNNLEIFEVIGLKNELCKDNNKFLTNDYFKTKFQLIQFTDIQEIILDRLEKELPSFLYYHNVKHTVDVVTQAELIGWGESVTDEELVLLKAAALFHDAGHIVSYDNHEYHGTELAREYLPQFGYSKDQIDIISQLIMVTKLPPMPKTDLGKIMCDADLDYLGRSDMIPVSNTLYKELQEQGKIGSLNDWNKLQHNFISGHQYFTKTARSLREVNKQKQIERIKAIISDDY